MALYITIKDDIAAKNNAIVLKDLPFYWKYGTTIPAILSSGKTIALNCLENENAIRLGSEHDVINGGDKIYANSCISSHFVKL